MVCIVDMGMGNITSVRKALSFLKIESVISSDTGVIGNADILILPGVGSFRKAMENLHERNLVNKIKEEVLEHKKPILGICLGMQLLADRGYEDGQTEGLGLISGEVIKLPSGSMPIPHIGWNNINIIDYSYFQSIKDTNFYFVHSYCFEADDHKDILATVDYEFNIAAVVGRENILGTQFHPEKSQTSGLTVLKNFFQIHAKN